MISIKDYLLAGAIIVLLTGIGISRWELYSVTKEFNEYKESQHDLIQKAKDEKQKLDKEKDDRATMSEAGFTGALAILNKRLQDAETVSGSGCMSVANSVGNNITMPEASTYTIGSTVRLAATNGICDINFYQKAMREHLQCQRLIELVK